MNVQVRCEIVVSARNRQLLCTTLTDFPAYIGRSSSCEVVIPEASISGIHALLEPGSDGVLELVDQDSTNGLYLGPRRVRRVTLDRNRQLVLGNVTLELHPEYLEDELDAALEGMTEQTIVCPHCWHRFRVEDFLFIARHQGLVGDPVLGENAQQRFLPSRFTPEGNAVDAAGLSCPDRACPRCHLRIPQPASEMPPLLLSIVGATASGKSYFLTSMVWELRRSLSSDFALSFRDADPINNRIINDFEEILFLNSEPDQLVALRKTELQGDLYDQVFLDNMVVNLPKPFMFSLTPADHHPDRDGVQRRMSRTLVMYDNAGEHFEPGMDSVDNPTTQHLLHSDTVFFLFDPTKDVRFRRRLTGTDPQLSISSRVQRQEIILNEMISRIKKYSGMKVGAKTAKSLIVLVSKADVWIHLLGHDIPREPFRWMPELHTCALDMAVVRNVSFQIRTLLQEVCPEIVATAEAFAGDIVFLPNSALGHSPELDTESGLLGIRPQDITPFWATVPMLCFFHERGFIPETPDSALDTIVPEPVRCERKGDQVFALLPGQERPLQVPAFYLGTKLRHPGSGTWFELPAREEILANEES
jgi:hypothetical protein